MNQNDINRVFTDKVTELIGQGYQINPATMGGSQGEIGKVDLRKGDEIIRVLLGTSTDYDQNLDCIHLMVGRCTDCIRIDRFESIGNTIWNNNLEILFEIKFAKIGENFFTDMETGALMRKKRHLRWKERQMPSRRDLPDSFKSAALHYLRRQPRMKTCKLSEIDRVTRINCSEWGETLPDLRGYEIVARGRSYFLPAPHAGR